MGGEEGGGVQRRGFGVQRKRREVSQTGEKTP